MQPGRIIKKISSLFIRAKYAPNRGRIPWIINNFTSDFFLLDNKLFMRRGVRKEKIHFKISLYFTCLPHTPLPTLSVARFTDRPTLRNISLLLTVKKYSVPTYRLSKLLIVTRSCGRFLWSFQVNLNISLGLEISDTRNSRSDISRTTSASHRVLATWRTKKKREKEKRK